MSVNAPFVFQLSKNDFGIVIVDLLKLKWTPACPFASQLQSYKAGTGTATEDLKEIAENETCSVALSILTNPLYRTVYNTGGSMMALSYLNVYANPSIDSLGFVSITPSFENAIMFQYYDTAECFAAWFVQTVSMGASEEVKRYLPAEFSLESLIFVFHAIDAFKRTSYQSMLDYKPNSDAMVSSKAYAETLRISVESKDIRWLLPAFEVLTPGLSKYNMVLGSDHMKILTQSNLFVPIKRKDTSEEFFQFGEEGRILSKSFYSSWMMAVGFETVVFSKDGTQTVKDNGFLAPTALGNHLILLEKNVQGSGVVHYRVLTDAALIAIVNQLLLDAVLGLYNNETEEVTLLQENNVDVAQPLPVLPIIAVTPTISKEALKRKFCSQCGKATAGGSRLCTNCSEAKKQ